MIKPRTQSGRSVVVVAVVVAVGDHSGHGHDHDHGHDFLPLSRDCGGSGGRRHTDSPQPC